MFGYIHLLTSPKVQPFPDCLQPVWYYGFCWLLTINLVSTMLRRIAPHVRRISPGTRMFLLTIYPPCLLNMLPYSYWASTCLAALPTYLAFMISVRQASDLPPASFRFPVTRDTLALGYILPAVGRIRDSHPLKHAPAGCTNEHNNKALLTVFWNCWSEGIFCVAVLLYGFVVY